MKIFITINSFIVWTYSISVPKRTRRRKRNSWITSVLRLDLHRQIHYTNFFSKSFDVNDEIKRKTHKSLVAVGIITIWFRVNNRHIWEAVISDDWWAYLRGWLMWWEALFRGWGCIWGAFGAWATWIASGEKSAFPLTGAPLTTSVLMFGGCWNKWKNVYFFFILSSYMDLS